ncbi:hypothetical protein [Micromonospora endophytica]|uniref:Uncharacterized protein n=1 Tax=Micromonospora endophytica TaxID=515350 RepID=A0A2W2CSX8_9ACTN|nr:hypothetical protein [Micromonospora endophytica]PZF91489.1 hypothetical protein C1I93_21480 [Micromonospora endophytica]RIW44503.1 hypothetical protein D3H59_17575 [Micromonospora endophytica]BCJ60476.1 hypothetical protein Jiend_38980 [Micromonospora endophytica]
MYPKRLATTGVALAAAFGLALTGCAPTTSGDTTTGVPPSSSAPADPQAELTAAFEQLNKQSARVKVTSPLINGSGVLDPVAKTSDMTMDMGAMGKIQMISTGDDVYLKMTGTLAAGSSGDKWLHMDMSKVSDDSQFKILADGDPGNVRKMLKSIVTVERTGPGAYAGTLDYSKAGDETADVVKTFGDGAKSVPFTAAVDSEGRLTELVIDMTVLAESLGEMRSTYSDFGLSVTATAPPAKQVEKAPMDLLEAFGG